MLITPKPAPQYYKYHQNVVYTRWGISDIRLVEVLKLGEGSTRFQVLAWDDLGPSGMSPLSEGPLLVRKGG